MKFHPLGYLVIAEDRKNKFRQSKGNNSAITDDTAIKLHVHNLTMVVYIQCKFHELPSRGYLDMAEDGKTEGWMDNAKPISLCLNFSEKIISGILYFQLF